MSYPKLLTRAMSETRALLRAEAETSTIHMRGIFLGDAFAGHRAAITVADFEGAIAELGIERGVALNLIVDSVGGDMAVSQYLMHEISQYATTVTARSRLYSAATHMAMGARRIVGAEGSDYLIHFPWTIAIGNAERFRQYAGELDDSGNAIVDQYTRRMAIGEAELRALMREEIVINDKRALEIGLIDEIIPLAQIDA